MKEIKHPWRLLAIVTIGGLAIDLFSKYLAARYLITGRPVHCIGDWVELVLIYNKGMVFGLDPGRIIHGFSVGGVFPYFNLIASIVLVLYYRVLRRTDRLMHWALALILPGALGNLFDRLVHRGMGVVDFIKVDLKFPPFNPWSIFNAADAWVTIGVGLMIASFIFEDRKKKQAETAPAPPVKDGATPEA
jgi:signal peptidase II